jgi:MATE family multidrug resistance protein
VRVSNELGAGQPHRARFAVVGSTTMVMVMGIIMATMVLFLQNVWGRAFRQVQDVLDCVSRTTSYLAVLTILNCYQIVLAG